MIPSEAERMTLASVTKRQMRASVILVIIIVLITVSFQSFISSTATSVLLAIEFGIFLLTLVSVVGTYLNTKKLVEQFASLEELMREILGKNKDKE